MNLLALEIKEELTNALKNAHVGDAVLDLITVYVCDQVETLEIDPRWKDYMYVSYDDEFDEVSVTIGPRDMQFEKETGKNVACGIRDVPELLPWE